MNLRSALKRGAKYSRTREPGLRDVDKQGAVDSDGIAVHFYRTGPAEPTATVVFVHGFTLAAESFHLQVRHLRRHHPGVAALLLDLRGHGGTGAVNPGECTVDGLAHDVRAVIAAQAPTGPLILLGHSLGGLAVLATLRQLLDDDPATHARVDGVLLLSTSIESLAAQGIPQVLASPLADRVMDAVEASPNDARRIREAAAKYLAPTLATAVFKRPIDYELVKFHAAMIHETPLTSFVGFFDDLQEHDELGAAAALQGKPGFVLTGEKDEVTPISQSERLREVWPQAWLQLAKGAGHMIILEAPDIINNALDRLLGSPDFIPE
ncbi:alpha/beta fold hydrolase [Corynebacterium sp. A21]|uniref:alpha/beta fold hydrolase n=1 Tax=Corynebacterium sp. A21 TaxID=3457318 RepID=UPI003FD5F0E4